MEIREFYGEEILRYKQLCSTLFHSPKNEEQLRQEIENDEKRKKDFVRLGAFEDELIAGIEIHPYDIVFEDSVVKMGGIGGVISALEARGKGAVKKLFIKAFEKMYEQEQIISHLFPFRGDYYRKFDYEVTAENTVWYIPTEYLRASGAGTVKLYDGSEKMKEDIKNIYHKFVSGKNLALAEHDWEAFFNERRPYESQLFSYLHYTDDVADGFLSYNMRAYEHKTQDVSVSNFWYTDKNGISGILGYIASLKDHSDKCIVTCNDDLGAYFEFNGGWGKRDTERKIEFRGSTRIIDAEKVLLKKAFLGKAAIKIIDNFCPWNNDVFTVSDGKVSRGQGDADASMTMRAFSSLVMGRYDNLDFVPELEIYKNKENLEKLFAKRKMWFDTHF